MENIRDCVTNSKTGIDRPTRFDIKDNFRIELSLRIWEFNQLCIENRREKKSQFYWIRTESFAFHYSLHTIPYYLFNTDVVLSIYVI